MSGIMNEYDTRRKSWTTVDSHWWSLVVIDDHAEED